MRQLRIKAVIKKDSFCVELERVFNQFSKYQATLLSRDCNAKIGRDEIFNPTTGNERMLENSNDTSVRLVNFITSKNLLSKIQSFHIATVTIHYN
jgi:hypothetical protein